MTDAPFTKYPRTTLWLVEGDAFAAGGRASGPPAVDVASFYLGKSVITNEQYEAFNPEHARGGVAPDDDDPVTRVSFLDATRYCEWYARVSHKPFRLPTGLEWAFAARGALPADLDRFAWHHGNSGGRCHAIEALRPNAQGLHDMLGLVWEWTSEPASPGERVLRGGSFRTPRELLGAGVRRPAPEDLRGDDFGFRIARSL